MKSAYSDKSYVTMEQHRCFACGKDYDTGSLLLDRRMREVFEPHTVTGMGLCPEHKEKLDAGFIILLGATDEKGEMRTGDIIYIKEEAFTHLFTTAVPPKRIAFIAPDVVAYLQKVAAESNAPAEGV